MKKNFIEHTKDEGHIVAQFRELEEHRKNAKRKGSEMKNVSCNGY